MKNQLFCLLLSCFFLLGNTNLAHAGEVELGGGVVLVIHNSKTETIACSFQIPEKYVNKDGYLVLPIEISVMGNSKEETVFLTKSNDLRVGLPPFLSGSYDLYIKIGEFSSVKKTYL